MRGALLAALGLFALAYIALWRAYLWRTGAHGTDSISNGDVRLGPQLGIGFVTKFMDTLGIGAFAPTTAIYKLLHLTPDDLIPGTINAGGALPVMLEAFIFIVIVVVDLRRFVSMVVAAVFGAWFGAGIVCAWPKRRIQIGLGLALFVAALLITGAQLKWYPTGGNELGLSGWKFWVAVGCNFMFAAFMQLGVGLYAPCMILIYLLGMNPRAAFPIMMGSCAFLMPVGRYRFIRSGRYSAKAAVGLTVGGIPAILLAAYVCKVGAADRCTLAGSFRRLMRSRDTAAFGRKRNQCCGCLKGRGPRQIAVRRRIGLRLVFERQCDVFRHPHTPIL